MRARHPRARALLAAAVAATGVLLLPATASAVDVTNGSFESGSDGWTITEWPSSGGDWSVQGGVVAPQSEFDIPAPPCGDLQALYDQGEPSSSVLSQDLVVDADATSTLTFTHWYENFYVEGEEEEEDVELQDRVVGSYEEGDLGSPRAIGDPIFASPATLDPGIEEDNQQYRVDIMDPAADPFSVDPGDVLLSVFATQPGSPAVLEPTEVSVDLTAFAGQTVRLRFAGVDNGFYFNIGVDCVELASVANAPTSVAPTSAAPTTAPPTSTAVAPAAVVATPRFTG